MDDIYLIFIAIVILILSTVLMVLLFRAINRGKSPKPNTMPAEGGTTQPKPQSAPMSLGTEKRENSSTIQPKVPHKPTQPSSENKIAETVPYKIYPDINLTTDSLSILESMNRLCQKYNIETCTLASSDGLAIASSYTGGTRDAAHFSNLYLRENITRQGDAIISPLKFQNQNLIIIVRSQRNLNSEEIEAIKSDEKRILLYWL